MLVLPSPSSTESSSASQGGYNCRKGHLEPLASGRGMRPSVPPAASEPRGTPPPPCPRPPPKTPPPNLPPRAASHRIPHSHQGQLLTGPPSHPSTRGQHLTGTASPHPRAASHRTTTPTSHQGSISLDHHPHLLPGQHLTETASPHPRAASHRTFLLHLPPGQHLTGSPQPQSPPKRTASPQAPCDGTPPPVSGFREEIEDCFFPISNSKEFSSQAISF